MIEIKAKIKEWGNSFGITLPKGEVAKANLKEGDEVRILITKEKNTLEKVFGSLKGWKIDSQKFKDEIRNGELAIEKRKWKRIS